jgi:hypothetical protein
MRHTISFASVSARTLAACAWITTLAAGDVARAMEPPFSPPTAVVESEDFEGAQGIPALGKSLLAPGKQTARPITALSRRTQQ